MRLVVITIVTHFGGASSSQVAEEMYLELYRRKVQFFRKIGGNSYADHYKRLLAIAYIPRILVALMIAVFKSNWRRRVYTYRRQLVELPRM